MSEAELSTLTHAELITKVQSLQKYIRRLTNYIEDLESRCDFQTALEHYGTLRHRRHTHDKLTTHGSTFALADSHSPSSPSSCSPSISPPIKPTSMYPQPTLPTSALQEHGGSSSMSPPFPPMPALGEEYSPTHPQKNPNLQARRMRNSKHFRRLSAVKTTNSRSVTPRFAGENEGRRARLSTVYISQDVTSRNAHFSPSLQQQQYQQKMESQQATQDLNGLLVTMRIKVVPPPAQPPPPPPAETPKLAGGSVNNVVNSSDVDDDDVVDDDDDGNDSDASVKSSDTEISFPMSPIQFVKPPAFSDGPTPLEMNTDDDDDSDISETDIDIDSNNSDDEKDEKMRSESNSPNINACDADNDENKKKKHKKQKKNKKKGKDKESKDKKKKKKKTKNSKEENKENKENNDENSQSEEEEDDEKEEKSDEKKTKEAKKERYPFGFAAVAMARIDSDGDNTAGLARSAPMKSPRCKESASSSKLPQSGNLWQQQQQQNTFQQNRHHYHTIASNGKPINKMLPRHSSKGSFSGSTSSLAEGTPPSRGERLSLLIPPQHALRLMNNGGFSTPQKIVTPSKQLKMKSFIHDDLFSNPMAQSVFVPFQDEL